MHDRLRGRTKEQKKKKVKARDNGEEKEEERKFSDCVDEHSSSDTTTESHARIPNEKRKSVDADDANTRTTITTTTTTTTTTTSSTKICRICMCEETESMPFVQLGCNCKGSMAFAHKVGKKRYFCSSTFFCWISFSSHVDFTNERIQTVIVATLLITITTTTTTEMREIVVYPARARKSGRVSVRQKLGASMVLSMRNLQSQLGRVLRRRVSVELSGEVEERKQRGWQREVWRVMPSKFALTYRDAIAVTPRCKIIVHFLLC